MFHNPKIDLFAQPLRLNRIEPVQPIRPFVHNHKNWPPDYKSVYAWRVRQIGLFQSNSDMIKGAIEYYKNRPLEFINDWVDTYDPRKRGNQSKWMPFILFERQAQYLKFLDQCYDQEEHGLVEKCRDGGLTWLSAAWSIHKFLFQPDIAIGWGSRVQDLVDKLGDNSSIFEKMRSILRRLPKCFLPSGWNPTDHMLYMRLINPSNGSTIIGETGDNIGRGGRTSIYFKDEAAHFQRPELVQAALDDNTKVQIDISSVNGLGNVFHRKREAGVDWVPGKSIEPGYTRIFVFDWSDHPEKTQNWYDQRRAKAEREGMLTKFAQEVDRDYAASVSNTLIPMEWIEAAVDAHVKLGFDDSGAWGGGLDIGDSEDGDRNGQVIKKGVVLRYADEWVARDPGVTARRSISDAKRFPGIEVQYDCIGIGTNVKSEYNRLIEDGLIASTDVVFIPWGASAATLHPLDNVVEDDPNSPLNKDFFQNLKAQAWWSLRLRFLKTWQIINDPTIKHDPSELISLDSTIPLIRQIKKELAQVQSKQSGSLKMMIDKKPEGTKSPNLADAIVMAYHPVETDLSFAQFGTFSDA